jgi:hypothetical protein
MCPRPETPRQVPETAPGPSKNISRQIWRSTLIRSLIAGDIRGFSWLTQAKKESEFEEKRRAFKMEMVGGPLAFFG